MPIKGLTDSATLEHTLPRFPRIGKLRKGGEKGQSGYGPDLDHWRFTSDNPAVVTAFQSVYGVTPKLVHAFLPYETVEENFQTWCEVWNSTGLVHRCDGETASIWLAGTKYARGSKPCPGGHTDNDPMNDIIGRLTFVIPELLKAGFVGYVTMETHSNHDVRTIIAALQAAYNETNNLQGILWDLERFQAKISVPGFGNNSGKRSSVAKWLVKMTPSMSWVQARLLMAKRQQELMLESGLGEMPMPPVPALPAQASSNKPAVTQATKPAAPKAQATKPAAEVVASPGDQGEITDAELLEYFGSSEGEIPETLAGVLPGAEVIDGSTMTVEEQAKFAALEVVPSGSMQGKPLGSLDKKTLEKLHGWLIEEARKVDPPTEKSMEYDRLAGACGILLKAKFNVK